MDIGYWIVDRGFSEGKGVKVGRFLAQAARRCPD